MPKNRNKAKKVSAISSTALEKLSNKLDNLDLSGGKKKKKNKRGVQSKRVINYAPDMVMSKASDTGLRRIRMTPRAGLSDQGIAFLKCAFAPPDFQQSTLAGVPDSFQGASLVRKHRFVSPLTLTGGSDYIILLLPVPGYAYFATTVAPGALITSTTVFTGVPYSDFPSMFTNIAYTNNSIVTKFRYVSNHIEIIPTVNQMIWTGSIQSWKIPCTVALRQGGTNVGDLLTFAGLEGVNTGISNQYSGPFIMGLYTACYNANSQFEFVPTNTDVSVIPTVVGVSDFGQILSSMSGSANIGIPGFDNNFESMCIRVSGVTANETCILKTWACVEYQINPNNALYEFQSLSPCDPFSIELYRSVISNLPVGVPFEDNENFWTRVLRIINQISGITSLVPGPVGQISRGTNLISGAILPWM